MEGKIPDESLIIIKKEDAILSEETEVTEKSKRALSKKNEINEGKARPLESQKSKEYVSIANAEKGTKTQKRAKRYKNQVLKRKLTEDGVNIERVLSEGEASSGFETISSIDSKLDFEDFRLSSSDSEHDYNVIVRIENDLAYQNNRNSDDICYWEDRSDSPVRNNGQLEYVLGKYTHVRHDSFRSYKQSNHWQRDSADAYHRYDRMDRWSRESEDPHYTRPKTSCDREWSRCSDHSVRSRGSRCSDQSRRSKGSICSDKSRRSKGSRTSHKNRSVCSRSRECSYRSVGSRGSKYKARQTEDRRSRSFDKAKPNLNRNLPSRRKRTSLSKSPTSSVWSRLDDSGSRDRLKRDLVNRSSRHLNAGKFRKKERTPFLVELERKLKEAETQKNVSKADLVEKQSKTGSVNDVTSVPEPVTCLNPNLESSSSYPPNNIRIYTVQHPPAPTMSLDNLPLVPGPTGLPVHITMTGEQIPHDMDGRRIPLSPNGYYLPVDPTGRLFAHIVSPGNQAVPIHMTEDGVLRLPNSEPVPYGPSHNLPVNIDGNVILMGPDSRPLCPCPNLPREPPLHLMQMAQSNMPNMQFAWQIEKQQVPSAVPQTVDFESLTPEMKAPEVQHSNLFNLQPPVVDFELLNSIQKSCVKVNKEDLLINYQKKARERNQDVVKCKEIEKTLGVSPSKGGVKRSTPKKLSQKKTSKDDYYSDYDMTLDSSDLDSASGLKPSLEAKQGCSYLTDKILPSSQDVQSAFSPTCDGRGAKSEQEDFITKKIKQALKSLSESNFKPPVLGRFIISEVSLDLLVEPSTNVSPLLRNRVKLPFLTPNASHCHMKDELATVEKTAVTFKFLTEEKSSEKVEKAARFSKTCSKTFNGTRLPVFTFDFAMQCDFTSAIIKNLSSKVAEMEFEVVRLRNINANLLDGFRNIREANEKKSEELKKALLEIEKRNNEILSLKCLISEKGKLLNS